MGRIWGSISSTVTSVPSSLKSDANSIPTTPPPMMTSRFGSLASSRIAVESIVCSTPLIGIRAGTEPVASRMSPAEISSLPTAMRPLPRSRAVPATRRRST